MAKRKPFYVYKRQKKHGSYWYVCYINPDTGEQENARSIDVLKEKLSMGSGYTVTDRDSAVIIASRALDAGLVFSQGAALPFNEYCLSFWNYDTSEYISMRNKLKKDSIGREYCMNMLSNYRNHVEPFLSDKLKLGSINVSHLDRVVECAFSSGLSSGSVQMVVLSFSIPLKEAVRKRLIKVNPASYLMKIPRSERERGVLNASELRSLAAYVIANDDNICLAVMLALSTGMRSGEIRALNVADLIKSEIVRDDGVPLTRVMIRHSLAPYSGLKSTKNKKERSVFITDSLAAHLIAKADENGVIFTSLCGSHMSAVNLRLGFYDILRNIGISESERKRRNITFHSLRHCFNTLLADEDFSVQERMETLGHSSASVNERYTHTSDKALIKASMISSSLWLGAEKSAEVPAPSNV